MTAADWPGAALPMPDGTALQIWRPTQPDCPPVLHFAHATGFHAHTYAPLFAQLSCLPIAAWDMRGHGASSAAGVLARLRGWSLYARDLGVWLQRQQAPVWLVGHSVGGTVSAMVAAQHPQRVKGLILIEPVLLSSRQGWLLRLGRLTRRGAHTPLAVGALRRRKSFASLEQAAAAYKGRGAFKTWPSEWLHSYVQHAFVEDASGWSLRCAPEWESRSFDRVLANPWPYLRRWKGPLRVILGAVGQSTCNADTRRMLAAQVPQAQIEEWPDASHFLPMENTMALANSIEKTIGDG